MCGSFTPARTSDLPRSRGSIPALLATPSSAKALFMNDSPTGAAELPDELVAADAADVSAFSNALRLSVRAKVAADQSRGLSLSEIVVQVREMVRLAEEDPHNPNRFPSREFRAISRQAVAWCVESYRPLVFAARNIPADPLKAPGSLTPVRTPGGVPAIRFPASPPTYRGLP
jgi:hypothetical protein